MISWWWLVLEAAVFGGGVLWAMRYGRTFGLFDAVIDPTQAQIELHRKYGPAWRWLRP